MIRTAGAVTALFLCLCPAQGKDNGQWEATDATVRAWYRELMQPDNPMVSCCGEADAYHADLFEVSGDKYVAIITDDREISGRPTIATGTKIVVPNHKLKFDRGNPTGHGVIFVSSTLDVYCYVVPSGI